ncbi:MAG: DNA/RNA nuclease SfsA [Candidatus Eremiobacteraeota bacterium]|nr:DNA/RNA nuclease SfsA [Candidatus Eremiobacteraeota bacterium]
MRFFNTVTKALFVDRPNRFLVRCSMEGNLVSAYLPNPGRLHELLLPNRTLYLVKEPPSSKRKTHYTVVGVKKQSHNVMLHTHRCNDVVRHLIEQNLVQSLSGARIKGQEVTHGDSRFDFLIETRGQDVFLEVKSCTLFGEKIAMFPDAETERGARHLRELAALAKPGAYPIVFFLVHYPQAKFFIPDFHTDLTFSRTFIECRDKVRYLPVAVGWDNDMNLLPGAEKLVIPWEFIEREAQDRGSYLLLMELDHPITISVGSLGELSLKPGYYIYAGSAMSNLSDRISRHYKENKTVHWHIDTFRSHARIIDDFPVRSSKRLECELARALFSISAYCVPDFGSSDCRCAGHLFRFKSNPLLYPEFINILQFFRIDGLIE